MKKPIIIISVLLAVGTIAYFVVKNKQKATTKVVAKTKPTTSLTLVDSRVVKAGVKSKATTVTAPTKSTPANAPYIYSRPRPSNIPTFGMGL